MRISDWSSDVCSSDLTGYLLAMSWSPQHCADVRNPNGARDRFQCSGENGRFGWVLHGLWPETDGPGYPQWCRPAKIVPQPVLKQHLCMTPSAQRSEEHTSELQSLMRISYAVFCFKNNNTD